MTISTSLLWLAGGALMMAIEAFGIPGLGFLFAGLAALCVGILIEAGITDTFAYGAQTAWWFGLTVVWAVVLWKPLKRMRMSKAGQEYSNIIGEIATVGDQGITRHATGHVLWSGTTMQAQIAAGANIESIPAGAKVKIVDIKGATLHVVPAE